MIERYRRASSIIDREIDYGEFFWFKGKQLQTSALSVFTPPKEIEDMLKRGWEAMLKITLGLSNNQTALLEAFSRTLIRESHVLTQYPCLLWQQLYDRL